KIKLTEVIRSPAVLRVFGWTLRHWRLWFLNLLQWELRASDRTYNIETLGSRIHPRAGNIFNTLTLASEIHPAALVLGLSPGDLSEFGPTSKGREPWSSLRLMQWKKESQKSLVRPISRSRRENSQNLLTVL